MPRSAGDGDAAFPNGGKEGPMKRNIMGIVLIVVLFVTALCVFSSSAPLGEELAPGGGVGAEQGTLYCATPDGGNGGVDGDRPEGALSSSDPSGAGRESADESEEDDVDDGVTDGAPRFTLSRRGKNVVILFIDRALGEDLPYIMNEKPELRSVYDGFTYYSNVISFGGHTNFGAPPIMGGYEYTPVEMNKRSSESLVSKHNESMKVLPVLFLRHGFNVTVCDAPYGNYQWYSDLSVYDDYPEIDTFHTTGYFTLPGLDAESLGCDFTSAYAALCNLTAMTSVSNKKSDNFVFFYNDTPHQPVTFREGEYVPDPGANNAAYDAAHSGRFTVDGVTINVSSTKRMQHYQTNMATMLRIGEWLDELREIGVYDNTKIIIVSDHGYYLHQLDELDFPEQRLPGGDHVDGGNFFPLLMVKDFNAKGFTESKKFMTNADVPTIACEGAIKLPINPFTGKPINSDEKRAHDQLIVTNHEGWSTSTNNGCTFEPCLWAAVTSNIWDRDDWRFIDEPVVLKDHKIK